MAESSVMDMITTANREIEEAYGPWNALCILRDFQRRFDEELFEPLSDYCEEEDEEFWFEVDNPFIEASLKMMVQTKKTIVEAIDQEVKWLRSLMHIPERMDVENVRLHRLERRSDRYCTTCTGYQLSTKEEDSVLYLNVYPCGDCDMVFTPALTDQYDYNPEQMPKVMTDATYRQRYGRLRKTIENFEYAKSIGVVASRTMPQSRAV